ncbi:MAG TPA: SURF1 family protein [Methylococcaceae bacterium]|nr:SURF1 family protein [Methylococcaceae bacterium]
MSATRTRKYTVLFFLALALWLVLVWALSELGMWQLRRAAEKQALMALYQARVEREPVTWRDLQADAASDARFRRVRIRGEYDVSRQFLLDNQVLGGEAGYHVLTPFLIDGGGPYILVNRGWIPLGASRAQIPALSEPRGTRELSGALERFPAVGLILKGAEIAGETWPSVVQVLDADRIGARLGKSVYALQFLLDAGVAEGYAREWRPLDLRPEKNKAYAFQWFSLAALTAGYAILWLVRGGARRKSEAAAEVENEKHV